MGQRLRKSTLASAAVGRDALVRNPQISRRFASLPEDIDRNAAAGIPVAADSQPARLEKIHQSICNRDRAIFVECAVVAEGAEIQLQRLTFDQPTLWHIVDHEMCEVRLSRHWAQRCELRRREASQIKL